MSLKATPSLSWLLPCLFCLFIPFGCKERTNQHLLSEREYHYDDRLSSISSDSSSYWIGGETGVLWLVKGQQKQRFDTGLDRIYDVLRDPYHPNQLWIASRNAGLQRWLMKGDSLVHQQSYAIPAKANKYSPYDIEIGAHNIYVATSQGLYALAPNSAQLKLLYPSHPSKKPFLVNGLCKKEDSLLFAATQEGLITVNLKTKRLTLKKKGENIKQVSVYGSDLYALSDKKLSISSLTGTNSHDFSLPQSVLSFYKVDTTYYFVTPSTLLLSDDLSHFVPVSLRQHYIPTNPHKIVIPNDGTGFSVLLTENAVWRIPHHIGVLNTNAPIIAAYATPTTLYYVNNQRELFRQEMTEKVAHKVYDFKDNDLPKELNAIGNDLYYYNANNQLCRLTIGNTYIINQLFAHPQVLAQPQTRITAMNVESQNGRVLLGVQDYLLAIDIKSGVSRRISSMNNKYITAFTPTDSLLYLSTLNDGVYTLQMDKAKPVTGTTSQTFLHGVVKPTNKGLIMLTNHNITWLGKESLKTDGSCKVLQTNDSMLYTIPENGIHKYVIRHDRIVDAGVFYADIHFNAQAALVKDGTLIVGSDLGAMQIVPNKETKAQWIVFDDAVPSLQWIGITIAGVGIIAFIIVLLHYRQRRRERRQMLLGKEDLLKRLSILNTMSNRLSDEEAQELRKINKEIDNMDVERQRIERTNEQYIDLSQRISRLNRDTALQMVKYLDGQMERIRTIDTFERGIIIHASEEARNSDNIEVIVQQTRRNEMWMNHIEELTERIEKFRLSAEGTLIIKGLNDGMKERINHFMSEYQQRPLADLYDEFLAIKQQYERLFSEEALQIIEQYVVNNIEYLDKETSYQEMTNELKKELEEIYRDLRKRDRILMLQALQMIDDRIAEVKLLKALNKLMGEFAKVHGDIIKENEERRMKKFDSKLFAEIDSATRDITDRISTLTAFFFDRFMQSDKYVAQDLFHFTTANSQSVKVLILLLAMPKVKRTLLPGMITVYGNLNPVVSRLYHGKIGENVEHLKNYCEKHPCSIVRYILNLVETN